MKKVSQFDFQMMGIFLSSKMGREVRSSQFHLFQLFRWPPLVRCVHSIFNLLLDDALSVYCWAENGGEEGEEDSGNIAAAAMWTRRDVQDFKSAVQQEGPNTVLRVGHGETVTVRPHAARGVQTVLRVGSWRLTVRCRAARGA